MSERKFKCARWLNPPFVMVRWGKQRPGLNFGIIKFKPDMKYKIYRYEGGPQYWNCHLTEKGSYLSYLKEFERCANFERIVRENGLEALNKILVCSKTI